MNFNEQYSVQTRSPAIVSFMSRVYAWMTLGLCISGAIAYLMASNPVITNYIATHTFILIGLFILQFIAVFRLSSALDKMSVTMATTIYLIYSMLSGVTLSLVFLLYTEASLFQAFFITAFSFAGLSSYSYFTKRDLNWLGSFCTIGLFGLIGIMLLKIFVPSLFSRANEMAIDTMAILIFAGLTAYDTQKIKQFSQSQSTIEQAKKQAIHGALCLYLDLINLFLAILDLFGSRR